MTAWSKYTGVPFRTGMIGPKFVDCWGLIVWVYAHELGIHVPHHIEEQEEAYSAPQDLIHCVQEEWKATETEEPSLDIEAFDVLKFTWGGRLHVGIATHRPFIMLHITDGSTSRQERYDTRIWKRLFKGSYRHPQLGSS